jgi:hypothetical protein
MEAGESDGTRVTFPTSAQRSDCADRPGPSQGMEALMQPLQSTSSDAPTIARGAAALQYEFIAEQNEVTASLGRAMRDVGRLLGAIGILSIIAGIARLFVWADIWQKALGTALWSLLQGGIFLVMGVWTRDAGEHLRRVATTTGADIQHLMEALGEVRHVYGLARVVIAAALVLLVLAMVLSLSQSAF